MSDVQVGRFNEEAIDIKPGFFKRLLWALFSPERLMKALAEKPRVLFWLLAMPIAFVLPYIVRWPLYLDMLRRGLAESSELVESLTGMEMTPELIEMSVSNGSISGLAGEAVGKILAPLVMALVFFAIFKLMGGKGKYKAYLSVVVHSNIIIVLYSLLLIAVSYLTGSLHETAPLTSLASMSSPDAAGKLLYRLLAGIDVFAIWRYGIMAVGFTQVSELNKSKVFVVTASILVIRIIAAVLGL